MRAARQVSVLPEIVNITTSTVHTLRQQTSSLTRIDDICPRFLPLVPGVQGGGILLQPTTAHAVLWLIDEGGARLEIFHC